MKTKPPAGVTDFQRKELCGHNSKSGRNYAKAKLIEYIESEKCKWLTRRLMRSKYQGLE